VRVNTIFEVVQQNLGATAWAGTDAATTDLLRGPSGKGLTEACDTASDDRARVEMLLRWIEGPRVPVLFGMSFTSFAQSQKTDGYRDPLGIFSPGLTNALQLIDNSVDRIVRALKAKQLFDSTWIAIASPYGQSPMDQRQRLVIPASRIAQVLNAAIPGGVAHVSSGDAAMIWLRDPANTKKAATALRDAAVKLGIQDIYWGTRLALTLNTPGKDPRMPDIMLQSRAGVVWTSEGDRSRMFHGGLMDEDTHVALMISGPQLTGRSDPTYVPTTQLAPLLLRSLGMEKFDLKALHIEHSPALPGIF
jgi:hypothetical protein